MGSKKEYTVGYWYGASLHMALCHGPVDALTEVQVGERTAWMGNVTSSGSVSISNRGLFGGEEREGGVDGTLSVLMGEASQGQNPYLASKLGSNCPAFRGVLTALWNGLLSANNPYIKPWRFRVRRIPAKSWYPAKAEIAGDANPAHILYECLTNSEWGMGYPPSDIDGASFQAAADTLYSEGFGMSFVWDQETSIEDFMLSVVRHVDGILFVHPRTGKFVLRLARADYTPGSLPVLNESNILSIEDFARPSWGEITNQVTVQYRDRDTDKDASVTVQDIAAIQLQGGVVATTLRFPGISSPSLAVQVATRELRQLSATLAKVTLVANREASGLEIGGLFRLSWPPYGITEMVMRIARIDYGLLADGRVRIEAVQDIFGLPSAIYASPPASLWTNPISDPAPCPAQALEETPYYLIVRDVVGEVPSILADISPDEGMIMALGARPSADAIDYHAMAYVASAWQDRGRGPFAPTALIGSAIGLGYGAVTVPYTSGIDMEFVGPGDLAIIDSEWLLVSAIDTGAGTITLQRGVLDTVPHTHSSGARLWVVRGHYITPEYVYGETAQIRLLPKTGKGELAIGSATTVTRGIDRRFIRPYPPANVQVNGAAFPASATGDLTITWANRNRVQQTADVVLQTAGNITPETGQTTTIRIYNAQTGGSLIRTYSGLTGTSQAYTEAQATADNGGAKPANLRIEVESVRGGYTSWQTQKVAFSWV